MQKLIKQNNYIALIAKLTIGLVVFALIFSVSVNLALARTSDTGTLNYDVSGQSNSFFCSTMFPGSYDYKVIFPNETLVGHKDPHASTAFGNIPAGNYKISILTMDSYADRKDVSQSNEQLYLSVGGSDTGLTTDLPDYAVTGYSLDVFDNVKLNYNVSSMVAKHISYKGVSGPNSVRPVCAIFEPINTNPTPELSVSCSANPTSANINQAVNWNSTASGGNGSYSYSWSGTDGLSGINQNTSKSYSTTGTKTATITVTSGGKTKSASCNANITSTPVNNNLNVSCSVDDSSVEVDEDVQFTANVTGGNGTYVYNWTGSDGLFSVNRTFDWSFDDDGTKHISVTVFSGSESDTDTCTVDVDEEENDEDFDVSCYADDSTVSVGERVRWNADVDGVDEDDVDYDWSGDEDLDSGSRSPSIVYDYPGRKEAYVRVRVNGDSETARCYVNVTGNTVLSYNSYNPNNQVLDAVYLSEVPYTGLADNIKLVWFIIGLALFSAYVAYVIIAYKKQHGEVK